MKKLVWVPALQKPVMRMKRLTYLLSGLVGTVPTSGVLRSVVVSCLLLVVSCLKAQPPIKWQKCLGGSDIDGAFAVTKASDEGYIIAGTTFSPNDGDVTNCYSTNYANAWVVKLDDNDNVIWQKCLGGSAADQLFSIKQTSDSGYVACGTTYSNDGDVSGNHGDADVWVVKLDANGNIQWQKCLGGLGGDYGASVVQTTDGGYIAGGTTYSYDGDVSGNHGGGDFWVVKLDASGNIQWQKCLGGSDFDQLNALAQTTDSGYVVTGYVNSNNGNVSGNHGSADMWIVKLDASGNLEWQKCLGGSGGDGGNSIVQTSNGNYAIVGNTSSNDGDVSGNHGGTSDIWIVKLDSSGNLLWQKCLGGSSGDQGMSVIQTSDSSYVVVGGTGSNDGDVNGNHGGSFDVWVVKLDTSGNIEWQKCLGGSGEEIAYSVIEVADSSYVLAGRTTSNDGNVSGNHGSYDYWVVKLEDYVVSTNDQQPTTNYQIYPNPANAQITIFCMEQLGNDAKVTVYNTHGQLLLQSQLLSGQAAKTEISIAHLPKGVYIVKVSDEKNVVVKKLIKE